MLDFYGVNVVTLACTSLICAGAVVAGKTPGFEDIETAPDLSIPQLSLQTPESGECWSEVM